MHPPEDPIPARLDAELRRLDRDHVVELELSDLDHLLEEPTGDPFTVRPGPLRSGIADLAATLTAARSLPADLTVRILLPAGTTPRVPTEQAEAALHHRAAYLCWASWRDASAVRNMGRAQLPIGLPIAVAAALVAYGSAYLASDAEGAVAVALLVLTAMIAITIAWVVSWMVIEAAMLDWRPARRQATAYALLARARLEIVTDRSSRER